MSFLRYTLQAVASRKVVQMALSVSEVLDPAPMLKTSFRLSVATQWWISIYSRTDSQALLQCGMQDGIVDTALALAIIRHRVRVPPAALSNTAIGKPLTHTSVGHWYRYW